MKILITESQFKKLILKEYGKINFSDTSKSVSPSINSILSYISSSLPNNDNHLDVHEENDVSLFLPNEKDRDYIFKKLENFNRIIDSYKIEKLNCEVGKGVGNCGINIKYEKVVKQDDTQDDNLQIFEPEKKPRNWLAYLKQNLKKKNNITKDDKELWWNKLRNKKQGENEEDFSGNLFTPSYNKRDFGYTDKNGKVYGLGNRSGISQLCKDAKKENNPKNIERYCKKHNHYGEDYPVKQGSEIYSKMGGVVLKAKITTNNCGGTLNIKMDDGTISKFCHLSKILVKKGDKINKYQLIALSGGARDSTGAGSSTGPHIHYGFKNTSGITVDPVDKEQKYWGVKK